MKWQIPAKTFFLGEYAALTDDSAIVLTTRPYFELSLGTNYLSTPIHPLSPAGQYWKENMHQDLSWEDPYQMAGGLGASTAQFLGAYLAYCEQKQILPHLDDLLASYWHYAWNGKGLKPSGYDLLAQTQSACVYINRKKQEIQSYQWPDNELTFYLIHTQNKLATHEYLQNSKISINTTLLSLIVEQARMALVTNNSEQLIDCVNRYYLCLLEHNLVATHTQNMIEQLRKIPHIVAAKGCGALGADIILILIPTNMAAEAQQILSSKYKILADNNSMNHKALI